MLRKAAVSAVAESIPPNNNNVTMKSNNNLPVLRHMKPFIPPTIPGSSSRSRSIGIWISKLRECRMENTSKHNGVDEDTIKKSFRRSPIRTIRITMILLSIILILIVRLHEPNWHRRYRFMMMMWYNNEKDSYSVNSLPSIRLLSVPKTVLNRNDLFDPYHRYVDGRNRIEFIVHCNVTTDVRGNLGPASVLIQNQTTDWIKDRWQAASDMHGTNIHGPHSVQLDWYNKWSFETTSTGTDNNEGRIQQQRNAKLRSTNTDTHFGAQNVVIQRIVLDWEAAYSDDYDIQIWNDTVTKTSEINGQWVSIFTMRPNNKSNMKHQQQDHENDNATTIPKFETNGGIVTTMEWGQSPGVTFPTPLHIIHNITLHNSNTVPLDNNAHISTASSSSSSKMRIVIHTSATGWGVSLWQVQVYGFYMLPK